MRTLRWFMVVLGVATLTCCNKREDSPKGAPKAPLWQVYKDTVPGTWTWRHFSVSWYAYNNAVDTFMRPDTTFPVSLKNDSTLSIFNHSLSYSTNYSWIRYPYPINMADTGNYVFYVDTLYQTPHDGYTFILNTKNDSAYVYTLTGGMGAHFYDYYVTRIYH